MTTQNARIGVLLLGLVALVSCKPTERMCICGDKPPPINDLTLLPKPCHKTACWKVEITESGG